MSWNLLERFIGSEHFNRDPSLTVAYLARYAEHVGIHHVLCSKLRTFSYEEIEFFLPQLCHLLISIDNESMALEEFIIDLCEESVNAALLTFWLLQTYLHDLSAKPSSNAFQTCRRNYNRVQRIVFGGSEPTRRERIKDNTLPVMLLGSFILGSIGLPLLPAHAGPLAIAQARKPRPIEDSVSDAQQDQSGKLGRSNTIGATSTTSRRPKSEAHAPRDPALRRPRRSNRSDVGRIAAEAGTVTDLALDRNEPIPSDRQIISSAYNIDNATSTASLPEQRKANAVFPDLSQGPNKPVNIRPSDLTRRHSQPPRSMNPSSMSRNQKIRTLRQHYFKSQLQFLTALEGIASRLVAVPKLARLSALRAELALIAQDLPAEIDIPLICPASLVDGTASRSKHHRIVRLNPAEATSLNSAQKVPYLLMLEIIRDDFDFNPESEENTALLARIVSEKGRSKRRLFDISDAARASASASENQTPADSVLEPSTGDLSSAALIHDGDGDEKDAINNSSLQSPREAPRLSSGVSTLSSHMSLPTPRTSEGRNSRAGTPLPKSSPYLKAQPNQADISALADHMRTASQMLAQLEISAARRPKNEVAAIKAKIIASMQSLEEQSFLSDDGLSTPNFDTIMAKATAEGTQATIEDLEADNLSSPTDPSLNAGKGAARMENDAMTGGIQRKAGDRDDPSAATFGEAWEQKKERIRRSSPYGWTKNWDLVSVIVKTGDDLRQEAFACQLIAVCDKIWAEHSVNIWVKNMRILVTGESSGLIETITNAVSLHSLKRSLTLASVSANVNGRKRFATLSDHYIKTFGERDSPAFTKALDCFVRSLAAYSIISYVLQLKDRHNGNILIDSDGHVIHIDFGFMLSNSPGNMGFEAAPFKFPLEYVELLGGVDALAFVTFKDLLKDAFQALRREAERIVTLVELMGRDSRMPCYGGGLTSVVAALRARFVLEKSAEEARDWVDDLVAKSLGSYYTRLYDTFQYRTQGIY